MTLELVLNVTAIALVIVGALLYFGARRLNSDTRNLLNQITRQQYGDVVVARKGRGAHDDLPR